MSNHKDNANWEVIQVSSLLQRKVSLFTVLFAIASDTGHKFSQSDSILSVSGAPCAAPLVLARL